MKQVALRGACKGAGKSGVRTWSGRLYSYGYSFVARFQSILRAAVGCNRCEDMARCVRDE